MNYTYKMIQVPPNIEVAMKQHKANEAAAYLEEVVNEMASQGWEFYRIDPIGVQLKPGCIASLFGQKAVAITYYVITFRKPA